MKLRERTAWAVAILILFIVAGVARQAKAGADLDAGLLRDSIEAANDRTRILTGLNAVLGANVQASQHRAIQQTQRADSLDHALKLERKAKVELGLSFESVKALNVAAVRVMTDSADSVRHASWLLVDQGPIDAIGITAHVPRPPALATVDLGVKFKPVPLGFRIGCGDPRSGEIGPAQLTVVAPKWMAVDVSSAEWDPAVCVKPPQVRAWWQHWQPWALATLTFVVAR